MDVSRRDLLAGTASAVGVLAAPKLVKAAEPNLPIVFVHGNGDTAGLWITTLWRFEQNGYPRALLHAVDLRYPTAQTVDGVAQPGRSSSRDVMLQLADEVADVKARARAQKVILIAQSRGGNTVRNYIKNGGGAEHTALAILCGAINHGVVNSETFLVGSEFNGASAFMRDLNGTPGEVIAGVRFVTIRSLDNDKYAQPDGRFLGKPGMATGIGFDGPALKGAENVIIPKLDHRETGYSEAAFEAMWNAINGPSSAAVKTGWIVLPPAPTLAGKISGYEADLPTNIGAGGARLSVYRVDPKSGERQGEMVYATTTAGDGLWGPLKLPFDTYYEFLLEMQGYPTTHFYRSPFAGSSSIVHMRPQLLGKGDKEAGAVVYLQRPRGYFGAGRDIVEIDGKAAPGIADGVPSVSTSKVTFADADPRPVVGRFNTEIITARTWPMRENHVSVIELTY